MDATFFSSSAELREWLERNHGRATELWIGFHKKQSRQGGITYAEAVDEALCFGWIDGIRKSIDDSSYTNRFTPRKPNSNWSAVNIKRAGELIAVGRMHPAGLAAFERRDRGREEQYSYENDAWALDAASEEAFRADDRAWAFFQAQPPGYRRTASWWVMSAKRDETRRRRLATLIEDSRQGRRLGLLARPETR
jgi:uncharacterized protein YdeI (YjbR/CyaY-like superfamily)